MLFWGFHTSRVGVSDFCTVADNCNYNASGVVLHVGGNYNQNHGLFYMNGNNAASNSNGNIGSRNLVVFSIFKTTLFIVNTSVVYYVICQTYSTVRFLLSLSFFITKIRLGIYTVLLFTTNSV